MVEKLEKRYKWARIHLIVMVLLTVVNIVWLICDLDATSMFAASLPMMAFRAGVMIYLLEMPLYAAILCGAAAVLIIAAYVTCWALSQKRGGWLIAASALFGVDVLATVYMVISSFVLAAAEGTLPDLLSVCLTAVFEVWVMVYLLRGVFARRKLKKVNHTS